MEKIEILTPEPDKALLILQDAIAWQKRILLQSLARTQERIQELAAHLQVDPELLLTGAVPHLEDQDMDLLELEGELEIRRHLKHTPSGLIAAEQVSLHRALHEIVSQLTLP